MIWRVVILVGIIGVTLFARIKRRVADETRFSRAMADLKLLGRTNPDSGTSDPWGNDYVRAAASSSSEEVSYWFSMGPDGDSATLGHDADDVNAWTRMDEWMERVHPDKVSLPLMWLAGGALVGMGLVGRGKRARRSSDGDGDVASP